MNDVGEGEEETIVTASKRGITLIAKTQTRFIMTATHSGHQINRSEEEEVSGQGEYWVCTGRWVEVQMTARRLAQHITLAQSAVTHIVSF